MLSLDLKPHGIIYEEYLLPKLKPDKTTTRRHQGRFDQKNAVTNSYKTKGKGYF